MPTSKEDRWANAMMPAGAIQHTVGYWLSWILLAFGLLWIGGIMFQNVFLTKTIGIAYGFIGAITALIMSWNVLQYKRSVTTLELKDVRAFVFTALIMLAGIYFVYNYMELGPLSIVAMSIYG